MVPARARLPRPVRALRFSALAGLFAGVLAGCPSSQSKGRANSEAPPPGAGAPPVRPGSDGEENAPGVAEARATTRKVVVRGEAMGGPLAVTIRCPADAAEAACRAHAEAARAEVQRVETLATDWRPEGEIARLNAAAGQGPQPVSPEIAELLRTALRVSALTDGAFDVTINALWGLWDWDGHRLPDPARLAERLPLVGWRGLHVEGATAWLDRPGASVTLGGIAQGYGAARALALIPEPEAMVDVSGDIALRGSWRVGVQHPRAEHGALVAALTATDTVLVTSGDYEHGFVEDGVLYHHILDPRTGMPGRGAMSVTVAHPDGATCDALSTALMVLGPDPRPVEALGAWALLVLPDGRLVEMGDRGEAIRDVELAAPAEVIRGSDLDAHAR